MDMKGIGYVECVDSETAAKTLHALDCRLLDGREIRPDYAAPLRQRLRGVCVIHVHTQWVLSMALDDVFISTLQTLAPSLASEDPGELYDIPKYRIIQETA
jgi:hypothetical protein